MDNFRYTAMPFGLKNVGATYQLVMTVAFRNMLHNCIEDYIDDIVVKSREGYNYVNDLNRVFEIYRKHKFKMNPVHWSWPG